MAEYNFNDLIRNIAENKKRASETRFSVKEKNEDPKDVFLSVCKEIANYYEPYGFKYTKTNRSLVLKRKDKDFDFKISFHTSRYNTADSYVEITVYANIISSKFEKWLSENESLLLCYMTPTKFVAGGQIGNLQENSTWFKWNVAYPETRGQVINDIIDHINKYAIPFFESFDNLPELVSSIKKKGEHFAMWDMNNLSNFLMYVSSKEVVEETFSNFLTNRNTWEKYYSAMENLKETGEVPDRTYWSLLALLTKQLNLNLQKGK